MELRHDALTAASNVILEVERLGREESGHKSVATVGKIDVPHQAMNVVPGQCTLFVDIRGICRDSMERIYHGLQSFCQQVMQERKVQIKETVLSDEYPVAMNHDLGEVIARNCEKNRAELYVDAQRCRP